MGSSATGVNPGSRLRGPYNTHMGQAPDVLVIGGGIIGLSSAYALAKAGLTVEVVDRQNLGREASWAGAGIIPPGNPDRAATPIDKLRGIGSRRFPELSAELCEQTGIDNGYFRCGGIEFLTPADEGVLRVWHAEGIQFERLTADAARRIEPAVAPPDAIPFDLPDCDQVRNPWHVRALIAACRTVGVRLTTGLGVDELRALVGGKIGCAVTRPLRCLDAGQFLVTVGAWADPLLRPFIPVPIRPVRGQIVLFNPGRVVLSRVLMVGKRYLVPRRDGRILVGSTEEPEAGFEKVNTAEGIHGLIEFACDLVPALRGAPVEKTWAGLRPGSPDGMPFIGPVPGWKNLYAAVGHFRAGVQLSIGTADLVTDLILGREPAVPAAAFRLDREPDLTVTPAFRS
jgi:glycine oxidase